MQSAKTNKNPTPTDKEIVTGQDLMKNIWKEMHFFLEEAESKVEAFGKTVGSTASSLEATAKLSTDEFRAFLHEGEIWFGDLLKRLQATSEKSVTALDTARVRVHLAKLDTQDRTAEMVQRVNRLKGQLDALMIKTERETNEKILSLSNKCHELRKILESTAE